MTYATKLSTILEVSSICKRMHFTDHYIKDSIEIDPENA
jgi:hypothetical protein